MASVSSRDFTHRLVVELALLHPEFRRVDRETRVAFVELIRQRIRHTTCSRPVPRAWDLDTWAYGAEGDRVYVANLKWIFDILRIREEEPSQAMMAWGSALLPEDFTRLSDRMGDPALHTKLKSERRMHNRTGLFVAYEWVEVTTFERKVLNTRYPVTPAWFAQYEVPANFIAEVQRRAVYFGLNMMEDTQSACCVVLLSEWLINVAGRLLRYAFNGRAHILPIMVVEWWRRLNLTHGLGSAEAQRRLQDLLDLLEAIHWPRLPYAQEHHFENTWSAHYSSGRQNGAGRPDRDNWVRLASGTLRLDQPEFLWEGEGDAERGGGGGRTGEVRVVERGGGVRRVRRRELVSGSVPAVIATSGLPRDPH